MKKGISIVSLTIVIIVIIILAGIVVATGIDSTSTATATMYAMEMLNIQTSVDEYYYRYEKYPVITEVTLNTSDIDSNYLYQFNDETIVDGIITFKAIDLSLIGMTDLEFGNNDVLKDIYVVSEDTGRVYYLLGVEYEGKIHYTLTDELYVLADTSPSKLVAANETKKYDVIFSVSNLNYTIEPVTVDVKIPINATFNTVTVSDSKSVSEAGEIDGYNVVTVNKTSDVKEGNYTIEVNYTYEGVTKTVTYAVTNFDNTIPTLTVDEEKVNNTRKITINALDGESGIKVIKYELKNIQDKAYFNYYGKQLNGTIFYISDTDECTIYVEDNAGNSVITYISASAVE